MIRSYDIRFVTGIPFSYFKRLGNRKVIEQLRHVEKWTILRAFFPSVWFVNKRWYNYMLTQYPDGVPEDSVDLYADNTAYVKIDHTYDDIEAFRKIYNLTHKQEEKKQ